MPLLPGDPPVGSVAAPQAAELMATKPKEEDQGQGENRVKIRLSESKVKVAEKNSLLEVSASGKSKRKSRSIEARGSTAMPKSRGSGFEEFFADPPVTPDEHIEETELYAPHHPFDERIEECVQRFRARRRLDNERAAFFSQYLMLGGIDSTPRMFNSAINIDKGEGVTRGEIRSMAANDVIVRSGAAAFSRFYNPNHPEHWDVDFHAVVAGFMSVTLAQSVGGNPILLRKGVDVVKNFLNYVRTHDVCPEYNDNIEKARSVCDKALVELPLCHNATSEMPGDFNLACRKLFVGPVSKSKELVDGTVDHRLPDDMDAKHIFQTNIILNQDLTGPVACEMAHKPETIKIVSTAHMTLEVVSTHPPDKKLASRYEGLKPLPSGRSLRPVGFAIFKHCAIESGWDMGPRPTDEELAARPREVLLLEADLLALLAPGFKLRATVCELNCDIKFAAEVEKVYPSFYTFLLQELMLNYKEPRPNERPGPSVDDPLAEGADDEEAVGAPEDEQPK